MTKLSNKSTLAGQSDKQIALTTIPVKPSNTRFSQDLPKYSYYSRTAMRKFFSQPFLRIFLPVPYVFLLIDFFQIIASLIFFLKLYDEVLFL